MARDDSSIAQIRLMTVLVILGVFVAGAAAGFGLARWFAPAVDDRRPPPPLGRVVDELGLEGDQREQALAIADRFEGEIEATMQEAFPKIRALREAAAKELRALLTPEQAARFDRLEAERPKRGDRRGHPHGPRGDRGPRGGFGDDGPRGGPPEDGPRSGRPGDGPGRDRPPGGDEGCGEDTTLGGGSRGGALPPAPDPSLTSPPRAPATPHTLAPNGPVPPGLTAAPIGSGPVPDAAP